MLKNQKQIYATREQEFKSFVRRKPLTFLSSQIEGKSLICYWCALMKQLNTKLIGKGCTSNVQLRQGFHEKVAVSVKPVGQQHSYLHINSERSHTIGWSPRLVLFYVRSPSWWDFMGIWRLQNSWEWNAHDFLSLHLQCG